MNKSKIIDEVDPTIQTVQTVLNWFLIFKKDEKLRGEDTKIFVHIYAGINVYTYTI